MLEIRNQVYFLPTSVKSSFMNEDKNLETVGDRIRWIQAELGRKQGFDLTDKALGESIGLSGAAIGQWKSNSTRSPTAVNLFAIEDKYGYSARWLATGKGAREVSAHGEVLALAERILQLPAARREVLLEMFGERTKADEGYKKPVNEGTLVLRGQKPRKGKGGKSQSRD